mgnify:CR=1 FL=1
MIDQSIESHWDIIKSPVVTEKSSLTEGTYIFKVDKNANKIQIKKAVEKIFSVNVVSVNTLNRKGKVKLSRGRIGSRSDEKLAYIKLKQGETIEILASN